VYTFMKCYTVSAKAQGLVSSAQTQDLYLKPLGST
jgi:hypothetical protein